MKVHKKVITCQFKSRRFCVGIWSSPELNGSPPPCAGFTLTGIDDYHAILYGGYQANHENVTDAYIIDFKKMVCKFLLS